MRISPFGYGRSIYIRLKDGNIAIYGHLRQFGKKFQAIAEDEQLKLNKYSLEALSNNQKKSFSVLLDDLAEKYDLEIYEFEEKYVELDVWGDIEHVSYHKNVTIFNEDVAKMIIMETIP